MRRVALIIGAAGTGEFHLSGVSADLANYQRFLCSAHGGAWDNDTELTILEDATYREIFEAIHDLEALRPDYSFVSFGGHGDENSEGVDFVYSQDDIAIEPNKLFINAPKKTLIIDACRKYEPVSMHEASRLEAGLESFDTQEMLELAKRKFNAAIDRTPIPYIKITSCSPGEVAGDDDFGGLFTQSFIDIATYWADHNRAKLLSLYAAYKPAKDEVIRKSNGTQHPRFYRPRMRGDSYPFSIAL